MKKQKIKVIKKGARQATEPQKTTEPGKVSEPGENFAAHVRNWQASRAANLQAARLAAFSLFA